MGEFLKKLRKTLGLSQYQLAAELGMAQSTLAHYEVEYRFPRKEYLEAILDYADSKGISYNINGLLNRKKL